jgi:hypothetical protein
MQSQSYKELRHPAAELAELVARLLNTDGSSFAAAEAEPDGPLFAKLAVKDVFDGRRFALVVEELL